MVTLCFGSTRSLLILTLILPTLTLTCSSPGDMTDRAIARWVPEISAEDRRVLAYGSESDWHALADLRGDHTFSYAAWMLLSQRHWTSREAWDELWHEAGPLLERIGRFCRERFDCGFIERKSRELRRGGYENAVKWATIWNTLRSMERDSALSHEERAERGIALLSEVEQLNVTDYRAHVYSWVQEQYGDGGHHDERLPYINAAYLAFDEAENHFMLCQLSGVVGSAGGLEGRDERPLWYWQHGRRLAFEHEIWEQWVRLSLFFARKFARDGDLSRANDIIDEVLTQLDRVDIGYLEIRPLSDCLLFYLRIECRDVAARVAERIRAIVGSPAIGYEIYLDRGGPFFAGIALASMMMSTGEWMAADSVFAGLAAEHDQKKGEPKYYPYWLQGLNSNGRYARTLAVYKRAESLLRRFPTYHAKLLLHKAEAEISLGLAHDAATSIREFDTIIKGDDPDRGTELTHRDEIAVRATWRLQGDDAARVSAAAAFRRLETRVASMAPASQGYIWIDVNNGLRRILHELAPDERTRYGIELVWQDLGRLLGSGRPPHPDDIFVRAARRGQQAMDLLQTAVHCVYVVEHPDVWRITADESGVEVDTLEAGVDVLSSKASAAWARMAREPEATTDPPDADLVVLLAGLSHSLLSGVTIDPESRLLVTAGGFLRRFPFETLQLPDEEAYAPISSVYDVGALRSTSEPATHPMGGTLIVADPAVSARSARRLGPASRLPEARHEAEKAALVLPAPMVFTGAAATRPAITAAWESAGFIYTAAHVIQDPQVPFLALMPLAPDSTDSDPLLSVLDIRHADLERCEMAVLSGCATGAPYVEATISGASLGDAFVDAGARVVVQTHWNVRDDHARQTMGSFLDRWSVNGEDAMAALGDVRRELMQTFPHPYYWAAYSVSGCLESLRPAPRP